MPASPCSSTCKGFDVAASLTVAHVQGVGVDQPVVALLELQGAAPAAGPAATAGVPAARSRPAPARNPYAAPAAPEAAPAAPGPGPGCGCGAGGGECGRPRNVGAADQDLTAPNGLDCPTGSPP
ncbi:hypothetical protein [Streptomyces xanthophaeus]|uniref:hypothetical protein n=1 Tax=Streptomyces xanthophaeus TaxID=67385 RepID=UPI0036677870